MRIYDLLKEITVWQTDSSLSVALQRKIAKYRQTVEEYDETDRPPLWMQHAHELWQMTVRRETH